MNLLNLSYPPRHARRLVVAQLVAKTVLFKWFYESLFREYENNITQGLLEKCEQNSRFSLVSFTMISRRSFRQIFNTIKNLYSELFSIFIQYQHLLFCFSFSHTFINVKAEVMLLKQMLIRTTLSTPRNFCNKLRLLLRFLYVHLIYCGNLFSKNLEANLKHLLRMGLVTDVIFQVMNKKNHISCQPHST